MSKTGRIARQAALWGGGALALVVLAALVVSFTAKPRADRNWYPYLARESGAEVSADSFRVSPISDWTYNSKGPVSEAYASASYRFEDLRNVWFVLEPQPGLELAAHTFLIFEFSNGRLLGVTIEARREADEGYSPLLGAFNAYELSYLWGSARDFLTRRAVMLQHETFIYPLDLKDETKSVLLHALLERTEALHKQPRFYNTLFSNCTNELAKAVNLKWHSSFIFTGTADRHLFDMKVIPGDDFAAARASADMTAFVKGADVTSNAAFDASLLQELRKRAG